MTPTPTPGQVAYATWFQTRYDGDPMRLRQFPPFADLQTITQQCWEAAAQAVLALKTPTPTMTLAQCMEELRGLVGQYWAGVDVDAYVAGVRGETGETPHPPPRQEETPHAQL